ncbi:LysR family transcriptional regulator [Paraburkholderia tropica]|uniref:LysR family transcriptional regulator n=1 Tax=Paraburkholderia tropica TaxID=92647 RepID=UPI001590FDC3|nr:LysR family transcriptional regulator [Paraburkholderia tropica]
MIETKQLQIFVTVVEEMHFSRAADRLDIAQSAVSTQIQKLEQGIGSRLFNRNKRQPLSLTDAGHLFYQEALSALRHVERAEEVGRMAAQGITGIVRLGFVASAVTSGVLATALKEFRKNYAQISLAFNPMETPRQIDALATGEIDVALVRPRRNYSSELITRTIHRERLFVAMAQDHKLSKKSELHAADLCDETFVLPQFNEPEGFSETLNRLGMIGNFTITSFFRVPDFLSAISLTAGGYGVALVPESVKSLGQPGNAFLPVSDFSEEAQLAIIYRKIEPSRAARSFVSSILNTYPALD